MSGVLRIAILGATGRMGREILEVARQTPGVVVSALLQAPGHKELGKALCSDLPELLVRADLRDALQESDVLIDFTTPAATLGALRVAADVGTPVVIGTTGLGDKDRKELEALALRVPVVFAPNMSVGVNAMLGLLKLAARVLGEDYDLEVFEMHHKHKVDAPSGTALRLAEVLCEARGVDPEETLRYGRQGVARREKGEIGMQVLRGGDVAGEHTVYFLGDGERLEVTHKASSRGVFAKGAVRAARWIKDQDQGLYTMQDVLGL